MLLQPASLMAPKDFEWKRLPDVIVVPAKQACAPGDQTLVRSVAGPEFEGCVFKNSKHKSKMAILYLLFTHIHLIIPLNTMD